MQRKVSRPSSVGRSPISADPSPPAPPLLILLPARVNLLPQVGFVSKSGGMSNELYNVIARAADGIYEGAAGESRGIQGNLEGSGAGNCMESARAACMRPWAARAVCGAGM